MPATLDEPKTGLTLNFPGYWFAQLEDALNRGDFDCAAEAGRELRRLGVVVTYPRPVFTGVTR